MFAHPYSLERLQLRGDEILELLGAGAIVTCLYLTTRLHECDVSKNEVYKRIYSRYYGLKGAALTKEFVSRYFSLLENAKTSRYDPAAIAEDLKKYPNRKGQLSLQFSFITKIGTAIDPNLPIYDSRIVQLFGIRNSKIIRDYDERLHAHLEDYEVIKHRLESCMKEQPIAKLLDRCRNIGVGLPDKRLADLILWAYHQLETKDD
jgi:hypothetical protein